MALIDNSQDVTPEQTLQTGDSTSLVPTVLDNPTDPGLVNASSTLDSVLQDKPQSRVEELGSRPLDMGGSPLSILVRNSKIGTKLSPVNFSQSILANPAISSTRIGKLAKSSRFSGKLLTEVKLPLPPTASSTK